MNIIQQRTTATAAYLDGDDDEAAVSAAVDASPVPEPEAAAQAEAWDPLLARVKWGTDSGQIVQNLALSAVAELVRGPALSSVTNHYREVMARHGKARGRSVKTTDFPGVVVGGQMPPGFRREMRFPDPHSGIVQFDFDGDGSAVIDGLNADPSVALAFLSPSGGAKACIRVSPQPADADEHVLAWKAANRRVCENVGLSFSTDADRAVKSANGLCFLAHDPEVYLNLGAVPIPWEPPSKNPARPPVRPHSGAGAPQTGNQASESDAAAALDFLAGQRNAGSGVCLAVGAALKNEGRSFEDWQAWAESAGCICLADLPRKWAGFRWDTSISNVVGAAYNRGWRRNKNFGGDEMPKKANPHPVRWGELIKGLLPMRQRGYRFGPSAKREAARSYPCMICAEDGSMMDLKVGVRGYLEGKCTSERGCFDGHETPDGEKSSAFRESRHFESIEMIKQLAGYADAPDDDFDFGPKGDSNV